MKRKLHDARMEERSDNDESEVSIEMFNKALKELWEKKGEKYRTTLTNLCSNFDKSM